MSSISAEDGLLAAQVAGTKDTKCRRIGELEEIALFRSNENELEFLVNGVAEMASDGSAAVRKAVVRFLSRIASQRVLAAAPALETCAFIVASGDAESANVVALETATAILKKYPRRQTADFLSALARERLLLIKSSHGIYGCQCLGALTTRDAEADADIFDASSDQKKPKASAETKASVTALATLLTSSLHTELEETVLSQIQFLVSAPRRMAIVHREIVSALISALELCPGTVTTTALSALYAAEVARVIFGQGGLLAAAANRLEAALRRVDQQVADMTDAILEAARNGAPMPTPRVVEIVPQSGLDSHDLNRLAIELIAPLEKPQSTSQDALDLLCRQLGQIRADTARPMDPRRRVIKKEDAKNIEEAGDDEKKRKFEIIDDNVEQEQQEEEDEEQEKKRRRRILPQVHATQAGNYDKESGVIAFALSESDSESIREALCAKLAALEPTVDLERDVRDLVLARLERYELAIEMEEDEIHKNEAHFVASRFKASSKSALAVLYECYATNRPELYDALLEGLLEAMLADDELSVDKNEFAETMCLAPRVSDAAIDLLVTLTCVREPSTEMNENALRTFKARRVGLGLLALREMALQRPASREILCTALLQLTRRPDVDQQVRDKATRLACNQLFPVVALQNYVLQFARDNARNTALLCDRANTEEDTMMMSIDDARRELGLIVPLCVKHLDLLPELVELVASFESDEHPMRQALDAELPRLTPALAAAHGAEVTIKSLLGPVVAATDNATAVDAIVAKILLVLAERGSSVRGPGLWTGATALYEALLGLNAKRAAYLISFALDDADASGFRHVLPTLLSQIDDDAILSAALKRAAASAPFDQHAESSLNGSGVIEALHALEPDNPVPMKRITDALTVCLKAKDTFGALTLREAIDRMTDTNKPSKTLPALLLRATILALKMYPSQFAAFVANTILTRLATHFAIWTNPPLWKGFIMLCTMLSEENGPNCFDALVALPAPQLTTVLKSSDKGAKLKLMLKRHAEKH